MGAIYRLDARILVYACAPLLHAYVLLWCMKKEAADQCKKDGHDLHVHLGKLLRRRHSEHITLLGLCNEMRARLMFPLAELSSSGFGALNGPHGSSRSAMLGTMVVHMNVLLGRYVHCRHQCLSRR